MQQNLCNPTRKEFDFQMPSSAKATQLTKKKEFIKPIIQKCKRIFRSMFLKNIVGFFFNKFARQWRRGRWSTGHR